MDMISSKGIVAEELYPTREKLLKLISKTRGLKFSSADGCFRAFLSYLLIKEKEIIFDRNSKDLIKEINKLVDSLTLLVKGYQIINRLEGAPDFQNSQINPKENIESKTPEQYSELWLDFSDESFFILPYLIPRP